jgi:hypothetical protein
MLTQFDKEQIISSFPNIKLSYENIIHKKVLHSDYIVAIPEGKKCFAWFTMLNNKPVCLIMYLTNNKQICDIKIMNTCFSPELSYGTILYGTNFYHLKSKFFSIEDIFCYQGNDIERICWGEKLLKINNMLKKDLRQVSYNNSFIVFGLPLMATSNEELERKIEKIEYKIDSIQFKLFNKVNNCLFMYYNDYIKNKQDKVDVFTSSQSKSINKTTFRNDTKREIVFKIKPDIQDDIYHLYCINFQNEEEHGIAHIPDYTTSVMMNKLFRIIKENINLDALEESDDEEEFENENIDKFVHLDKSYKMVCQFNHKFKKWVPIKLAKEEDKVISNEDLKKIYKSYEQNRKK